MKFFAAVLFVFALVLCPTATMAQAAGGSGPAGNWELTINTPQEPTVINLTLRQEGVQISGTLSSRLGSMPVTGTAGLSSVVLTAKIELQGTSLQIGINGNLEGDSLNGTVELGDFGDFPFTGKRVAPTPAAPAAAAPAAGSDALSTAAGKWNIVISVPGVGELPATGNLTQDSAGIVGGVITSPAGEVNVSGTLTGTSLKLDFKAVTPQGDIPITMTGELTATGLSGKATIVGMGEAGWTATRVQ